MKKLSISAFCFLLSVLAFAQPGFEPDDLALLKPAESAVSDPYAVFYAYWKPSATDYTTNAGLTTLTDLRSGTYPLTNTAAADTPPRIAADLDGQDILRFNGTSHWLRNAAITTTQPNETWAILALGSDTSGVFLTANSGGANRFLPNGDAIQMNAGTSLSGGSRLSTLTNRWFMYRLRYNGASSFGHTNGVAFLAGNAGSGNMTGLLVGAETSLNFETDISVAWLGVTSSNLTDADANSVSNALRFLYPSVVP